MNIVCVHNRYQQHGGEDEVFEAETALLEANGHAVTRLEFDNHGIPDTRSVQESLRLAMTTIWSREGAKRVRDAVRSTQARVVHFANTFPLVSPAAYSASRAEGAAVVQTVHNYRMMCPTATFYRDGGVCEDCLGRAVPWPGVVHACYRGSRAQTAVVAAMLTTHRARRTWDRDVDTYIATTAFSRQKLIEGGFPPHKLAVKPNFLASPPPAKRDIGEYFLFVGRLSPEKGIDTLVNTWTTHKIASPLHIAGVGPCEEVVTDAAKASAFIKPVGRLPRSQVLEQMRGALALVFPSVWYEGFPVTIVEALACGLPVIASRLGAMAEIIADGETGLLFDPGDPADLARKLTWARNHPDHLARMAVQARREFERKYTAEQNYAELLDIYERAVAYRRQDQ